MKNANEAKEKREFYKERMSLVEEYIKKKKRRKEIKDGKKEGNHERK